ncbi:hypothetical protein Tco_0347910 [Tanacetum coccineum]
MKFSTLEDDECLSIDMVDKVVSDLVNEILPLSPFDSFLFEPIMNYQQKSNTNLWEEEDDDSEDLDKSGPPINLKLALTRGNQAPSMVKPEIEGNVNFEIKSQFMRELREDTFFRNKNDDAHEYVERVLDIVTLFNIPGISHDAVMLRVFPITLTGSAKRWVDRLPPGTINSWDLLKKAFIQRYCPPSKTAKQHEEIRNIKQEGVETLYQAWECRKIESSSNSEGITAIVSKLDNLGQDMKNLKENVYAIQVGCQNYEGAHLDKDCLLNEEVKSVEEAKYGEFGRSLPFSNGAKYRVSPPGYYTRIDNRPPFGEKRPSLEELMNKHLEEST